MKKIGLVLILVAAFMIPAARGRAQEIVIPKANKIVKMTGTVQKVEVEKMYLTFRADKENKSYRIRGAKAILDTLKPGDRIEISVADNDSIKYIRKLETAGKGKKNSSFSPGNQPAAEKTPAPSPAQEKGEPKG